MDRLSAPMNMLTPVNEYTLGALKGFARWDSVSVKTSSALERGSYCCVRPPKGASVPDKRTWEGFGVSVHKLSLKRSVVESCFCLDGRLEEVLLLGSSET